MPAPLQKIGFVRRFGPYLERCRARFGDTFTLRLPSEEPVVIVSHPQAIEQVFKGDRRVFHAGEGNEVMRPVLGDASVFVLDDDAHLEHRKMMLPPFHGQRMERYGSIMRELAAREISRWPVGEPLSMWPRMRAVTLEVIIATVFGARDRDRFGELHEAIVKRAHRRVKELLLREIRGRRKEPDPGDDVMSTLIRSRRKDGRGLSDEELRDALMTAIIAGHESAATSLTWAIERLVRHPHKLERLRAEVTAGDDAYVNAVVQETLRLRPSIGFVHRRLTEPVDIGGWRLPAGTRLLPCIHLLHRRLDLYPEPARFLPERFLDNPAGTYTWIPFGGGTRRCVGASFALFEMRQILAVVASHARLRPSRAGSERAVRAYATVAPERDGEVIVESLDEVVRGDGRGRRVEQPPSVRPGWTNGSTYYRLNRRVDRRPRMPNESGPTLSSG